MPTKMSNYRYKSLHVCELTPQLYHACNTWVRSGENLDVAAQLSIDRKMGPTDSCTG